jgi:pyruvate ferredoxin oxidoreductase beta subunit
VESGLFPLYEAIDGRVVRSTPIRRRVPAAEYLRAQGRFAHLFNPPPGDPAVVARLQAMADANVEEYRLERGGIAVDAADAPVPGEARHA